jgi:hypothetical protein
MRRRLVVAASALIAVVALVGLPGPAGSRTPSRPEDLGAAAFTALLGPASPAPQPTAPGFTTPAAGLDAAARSAGFLGNTTVLEEPASGPTAPSARTSRVVPAQDGGSKWKTPRLTLTGWATFYDNGTTAMRLPYGTTVVICGAAGCIERVVSDYGPIKKIRVVDMYRPDFFKICGCGSWAGTAWVTVWIY